MEAFSKAVVNFKWGLFFKKQLIKPLMEDACDERVYLLIGHISSEYPLMSMGFFDVGGNVTNLQPNSVMT